MKRSHAPKKEDCCIDEKLSDDALKCVTGGVSKTIAWLEKAGLIAGDQIAASGYLLASGAEEGLGAITGSDSLSEKGEYNWTQVEKYGAEASKLGDGAVGAEILGTALGMVGGMVGGAVVGEGLGRLGDQLGLGYARDVVLTKLGDLMKQVASDDKVDIASVNDMSEEMAARAMNKEALTSSEIAQMNGKAMANTVEALNEGATPGAGTKLAHTIEEYIGDRTRNTEELTSEEFVSKLLGPEADALELAKAAGIPEAERFRKLVMQEKLKLTVGVEVVQDVLAQQLGAPAELPSGAGGPGDDPDPLGEALDHDAEHSTGPNVPGDGGEAPSHSLHDLLQSDESIEGVSEQEFNRTIGALREKTDTKCDQAVQLLKDKTTGPGMDPKDLESWLKTEADDRGWSDAQREAGHDLEYLHSNQESVNAVKEYLESESGPNADITNEMVKAEIDTMIRKGDLSVLSKADPSNPKIQDVINGRARELVGKIEESRADFMQHSYEVFSRHGDFDEAVEELAKKQDNGPPSFKEIIDNLSGVDVDSITKEDFDEALGNIQAYTDSARDDVAQLLRKDFDPTGVDEKSLLSDIEHTADRRSWALLEDAPAARDGLAFLYDNKDVTDAVREHLQSDSSPKECTDERVREEIVKMLRENDLSVISGADPKDPEIIERAHDLAAMYEENRANFMRHARELLSSDSADEKMSDIVESSEMQIVGTDADGNEVANQLIARKVSLNALGKNAARMESNISDTAGPLRGAIDQRVMEVYGRNPFRRNNIIWDVKEGTADFDTLSDHLDQNPPLLKDSVKLPGTSVEQETPEHGKIDQVPSQGPPSSVKTELNDFFNQIKDSEVQASKFSAAKALTNDAKDVRSTYISHEYAKCDISAIDQRVMGAYEDAMNNRGHAPNVNDINKLAYANLTSVLDNQYIQKEAWPTSTQTGKLTKATDRGRWYINQTLPGTCASELINSWLRNDEFNTEHWGGSTLIAKLLGPTDEALSLSKEIGLPENFRLLLEQSKISVIRTELYPDEFESRVKLDDGRVLYPSTGRKSTLLSETTTQNESKIRQVYSPNYDATPFWDDESSNELNEQLNKYEEQGVISAKEKTKIIRGLAHSPIITDCDVVEVDLGRNRSIVLKNETFTDVYSELGPMQKVQVDDWMEGTKSYARGDRTYGDPGFGGVTTKAMAVVALGAMAAARLATIPAGGSQEHDDSKDGTKGGKPGTGNDEVENAPSSPGLVDATETALVDVTATHEAFARTLEDMPKLRTEILGKLQEFAEIDRAGQSGDKPSAQVEMYDVINQVAMGELSAKEAQLPEIFVKELQKQRAETIQTIEGQVQDANKVALEKTLAENSSGKWKSELAAHGKGSTPDEKALDAMNQLLAGESNFNMGHDFMKTFLQERRDALTEMPETSLIGIGGMGDQVPVGIGLTAKDLASTSQILSLISEQDADLNKLDIESPKKEALLQQVSEEALQRAEKAGIPDSLKTFLDENKKEGAAGIADMALLSTTAIAGDLNEKTAGEQSKFLQSYLTFRKQLLDEQVAKMSG